VGKQLTRGVGKLALFHTPELRLRLTHAAVLVLANAALHAGVRYRLGRYQRLGP
jgi:hypothetical protein